MSLKKLFVIVICAAALAVRSDGAPHKRALLIGINDYSASQLPPQAPPAPGRDWPDLRGAVNDVESMREMLVLLHGFTQSDIVTLTDQAATRRAILQAIETRLVAPAASGDVVFFYYAGHGAQVRNTRSDEPDEFDESIVPADSRRGAPDIRDKELRALFNAILDRGARLTIMLDDCHAGSGARGLPAGGAPRGIKPDLRDVADGSNRGPRPEHRGALVLSASQDFEDAREKFDHEDTKMRGVFTWAWMRAMRDALPGETALETFLRARARLRAEIPVQEPVLASSPAVQRTPFLETSGERRSERAPFAVVKIQPDGTVVVAGGWANGLTKGSELRVPGDPTTRLSITRLVGLGGAEARVERGRVESGTLLEPAGWLAAPARPLRLCMPRVAWNELPIGGLARLLAMMAARRHIRWINDPTVTTPDYVLRRGINQWELLTPDGAIKPFAADDEGAENAVDAVPRRSSLFVQLPAPAKLVERLSIAAKDVTDDPADADYILTGRYAHRRLTYAWVRPGVTRADRHKCGMPVRSAWTSTADDLRDTASRLRRIAAWQALDSPPYARSPYHLELRHGRDDAIVRGTRLTARERYRAVLRGMNLPPRLDARFVYVFVIDSDGRSVLLYPRASSGSVENCFPLRPQERPPEEIPLAGFEVSPPFGVDTYFVLTTEQALPNPSILEWNGVRQAAASPSSPLEQLLAALGSEARAVVTPGSWSIERTVWESAPQKRRGGV